MTEQLKKPYKFLELKPFVPDRTVKDYSPEQKIFFQDTFKCVAEKYRARAERSRKWIMMFAASLTVAILVPAVYPSSFLWLFPIAMSVWLVAVLIGNQKVNCPACHNIVNGGYGSFCPQCGKTLKRYGLLKSAGNVDCAWCGIHLMKGKGKRNYQIRHCTYCAVHLDQIGI